MKNILLSPRTKHYGNIIHLAFIHGVSSYSVLNLKQKTLLSSTRKAALIIPSETLLQPADDLAVGPILMHGVYPTNSKLFVFSMWSFELS
jgi:hypothetical protein